MERYKYFEDPTGKKLVYLMHEASEIAMFHTYCIVLHHCVVHFVYDS